MNTEGNPLVSVIAPAFRCGKFVGPMIESIQAQTYPWWELIVMDDGSDDNTLSVAQEYASKDPRVQAHTCNHGGYPKALNNALALAKGDLIARQDSDDWSHRERFADQVRLLLRGPFDLVSTQLYRMYSDGRRPIVQGCALDVTSFVRGKSTKGPVCGSILARRQVYDIVGPYNPEYERDADSEWVLRSLTHGPPGFRWGFVQRALYFYRDHPDQITKAPGLGLTLYHKAIQLHKDKIAQAAAGKTV